MCRVVSCQMPPLRTDCVGEDDDGASMVWMGRNYFEG